MSDMSATVQDYLKHIWAATEWSNEPVKTSSLARQMGLSASTVSETIARLAREGLVEHEKYQAIRLTPEGTAHALAMVRAHRLIETFLHSSLGYSWDEVHVEADAIEHAVSPRFIDAIDEFLGRPTHDPHGDPIPTRAGILPRTRAVPLREAADGIVTIVRVDDGDPELLREASRLGLHPGHTVTVVDGMVRGARDSENVGACADIVWVTDPSSHPPIP